MLGNYKLQSPSLPLPSLRLVHFHTIIILSQNSSVYKIGTGTQTKYKSHRLCSRTAKKKKKSLNIQNIPKSPVRRPRVAQAETLNHFWRRIKDILRVIKGFRDFSGGLSLWDSLKWCHLQGWMEGIVSSTDQFIQKCPPCS